MQYKNKVYFKIVRCNTVFNYDLEISKYGKIFSLKRAKNFRLADVNVI